MSSNEDELNIIPELTCHWARCQRKILGKDKLPVGWKYLAISSGKLFIEENLLRADIDGVLCPEHSIQLYKLLKIDASKVKHFRSKS